MTIIVNYEDIEASLEGILELHDDVDEETARDILASMADHVGNSDDILTEDELENLVHEAESTVESIDDEEWHQSEYAADVKLAIQTGKSIIRT